MQKLAQKFPLISRAYNYEKTFRKQTIVEITELFNQAKLIWSYLDEKEQNAVVEGVCQRVISDAQGAIALDEIVKSHSSDSALSRLPKFCEIVSGCDALISQHGFGQLIEGARLSPFLLNTPDNCAPVFCDKYTIWGTSSGTFLKAALLTLLCEMHGRSATCSSLDKNQHLLKSAGLHTKAAASWLHGSALVSAVTFPPAAVDLLPENFTFLHVTDTACEIVFPHSGYGQNVSGGGTLTASLFYANRFPPQDQFSFISAVIQSFVPLTAALLFRAALAEGDERQSLWQCLRPVHVMDFERDIHAGMLLCWRNDSHSRAHCGIVLHVRGDGQVQVLSCEKNGDIMEGIGVKWWQVFARPGCEKALYQFVEE
eukprot:TRINITY_DN2287_c0_g1_i1.p1 TRINITY_DN2287_c0_g1~~TRINITY_DN2287_c0_g1_i1.p1  ORF type:complete len:370 (-),score=67.27 TRINITY_DN2287_c0_g1_i1:2598-3707(-)